MGVFAQRYDAAGAPRGPEFRVNVSEEGKQFYPSVALQADGGFVIAFHASDAEERDFEVLARRFGPDGEGAPEFQLNDYTDALQRLVRIAPRGLGFVAVWESYHQDGDGYGIFARRYDALASVDETEWQVNAGGDRWQQAPAVAAGADGRFVVAWHENSPQGTFWLRVRVFAAE